ncbi:MAG: hypothetical protein JW708_09915 [Vallitaleaceae bacterium]|nr:hypothetical protein [Vallitaleaceae bacterium]
MDGKVLMNIIDTQLKRQLMMIFVDINVQFIECYEGEDVNFKIQMLPKGNRLYIHELSFVKQDCKSQFLFLEGMKSKGFRVLVILPQYKIDLIDECQRIRVDDVFVVPEETKSIELWKNVSARLKNKILMILTLPESSFSEEGKPEVIKQSEGYAFQALESYKKGMKRIQTEIVRARRGKYPLSFVMIYQSLVPKKAEELFMKELKKALRTTDTIIEMESDIVHIVLCPFTDKKDLVLVENKVRRCFEEVKQRTGLPAASKCYLYGLAYGTDGENFEEIYEKLDKSIKESKAMDENFIKERIMQRTKKSAQQGKPISYAARSDIHRIWKSL